MTWTTPVTWTVNQIIPSSTLNTQVRDNFIYLYSRPQASFTSASTYTTASTTIVAMSTSTARLSFTTSHANSVLLLGVHFLFNSNGGGGFPFFDIYLDTATSIYNPGAVNMNNTVTNATFSYTRLVTIATASAHTIDLMFAATSTNAISVIKPSAYIVEVS